MEKPLKLYYTDQSGIETYIGRYRETSFELRVTECRHLMRHLLIKEWCIQRATDGVVLACSKGRKSA